jgi:hypothetical protein
VWIVRHGPNSDLIRGKPIPASTASSFPCAVDFHVTCLVVRFPELIGSWSWRDALDRRDKFRWIRSDGKDLEGRSKVVCSQGHAAASYIQHVCFSYLSSSSITFALRVLLYLEGRCCFDFDTLSSLLPTDPPPKTQQITTL